MTGGPGEQAEALRRSAQAHRDAGDLAAAMRDQAAAVTLYRETEDARALAHAIRHLGDMFVEIGLPEQAAPLYREMLARYRLDPGTPPLELANATRSLALHRERLGDREAALKLWRDARNQYRRLDAEMREMTAGEANPGVAEAEARIARLSR